MNCKHVQFLLPGYIDGELDLVNAIEIEEHLQDCAACLRQYRELIAIRAAIHDTPLLVQAPPGLEKRIRSSIRKEDPQKGSWRPGLWAWAAAAVFLIAAAILTAGLRGFWFSPNQEALLAQEVQSSHVRSMMADHLTDVTSSDQHTVKPWFDGKLDFAPPVVDLASNGFPLIGGRLDYLENHPAAALVYKRDKHIINLFIWPSTGQVSQPSFSTDNGYNLAFWSQSGMTYGAISDLNPAELRTFVNLIQQSVR